MKSSSIAIVALAGLSACNLLDPSHVEPQAQKGATAVFQDFETLTSKNTVTDLGGWLNIMCVDSAHPKPLQWVAYQSGCNLTVQASAHLFDNSNYGIAYETWLISPPLDVAHANSKVLTFDLMASYWTSTSSLDVFLLDGLEGTTNPAKRMRLPATMPDANNTNAWLTSTIDFSQMNLAALPENALVGFCYRAIGGSSNSTSFYVDNFCFGDVDAALRNARVVFSEPFDKGLGAFTEYSVEGAQRWTFNSDAGKAPYSKCAKITGYANSKTEANTDWLISSPINLSAESVATLTFEQAINKGTANIDTMRKEMQVLISTDCDDTNNPDAATWKPLNILQYPNGTSWTFICSGKVDLTPYCGKPNVRIAFLYRCNDKLSANWGIRNVKISR